MDIEQRTYGVGSDDILQLLKESQKALSVNEIRLSLKLRHNRVVPNFQIIRYLRGLLKEGNSSYSIGRWTFPSEEPLHFEKIARRRTRKVAPPILSPLGIDALNKHNKTSLFKYDEKGKYEEPEENSQELKLTRGPWAKFRNLISYYKECVRSEEGADASAFLDDFGSSYLYFAKSGDWYPKPGRSWSYIVPLGEHISEFVRAIEKAGEDVVVVLGYPLQGVYIVKNDEPDQAFIRPVFHYQLKVRYSNGVLALSTVDSRPSVNLEWLKYAFQSPGQQRNFLAACGLLVNSKDSEETNDLDVGHDIPRLDTMVTGVSAFLSDKIRQPLLINEISSEPLDTPFETGIYNKAVIMIGKKTRFTKTLINELTEIEQLDDTTLDKTALKYIFKETREDEKDNELNEPNHESCVIDTDLLNMEQREAVAALLNQNISVITGPPGTGKSQVVSSAITNSRLTDKTTLFASRNHKAIDAVVNRCKDKENRPLVIRTNSKEDPSLRFTFITAIRDLLTANTDKTAKQYLDKVCLAVKNLLKERGEIAECAYELQTIRTELGEVEEQLSSLEEKLPEEALTSLNAFPRSFPASLVKGVNDFISKTYTVKESSGLFTRVLGFLCLIFVSPQLFITRLKTLKYKGLNNVGLFSIFSDSSSRQDYFEKLMIAANYAEMKLKAASLEKQKMDLPAFETLTTKIEELSEQLADRAKDGLSLDLNSRSGIAPDADIRENLASLKVALSSIKKGIVTEAEEKRIKKILKQNIPLLLNHFPCWAVTNLSAGSRIPLFAGMYDLAIVDEASQSDIASAIPILFRAKRAAVVGDPQQLTHSSKLSVAKETLLRKSSGLIQFEDLKYSYSDTSLYDLFAQTKGVKPIFLSNTYRSVDSIAQYSNTTFYDGRLRVATNSKQLKVPENLTTGIHWTNVSGEVASAGGAGCFCAEEIEAVVELIITTLRVNKFRGTLGVVTPFRQQANRINDALYESGLTFEELERAQVHVDTSHGFQGDERDVILFSLCAGPDMPSGSRLFLRETANLFNVAVSRARAVLHVLGNREWAERCGIKHIQNLAHPIQHSRTQSEKGQWYPHESPWEKILFDALVARGLNPIPQYPVAGRRLDMSLVGTGEGKVKIDVEVDGDRYHRNRDGSRKKDDVWRDIQIQGMGWMVNRFWVYELRENLESCVDKILKNWEKK